MDNEEIIGQRRYLSSNGVAPLTCDRCGLPVEDTEAVVVEGKSGLADPVESAVLCASCLSLIQRGLEPVELADIDDDVE